jgi:cysteine-rich repeat protein
MRTITLLTIAWALAGCQGATLEDPSSSTGLSGADDGGITDDAGDAGPVAVCGNGVREPGEQCDDGNTLALDGCDSKCRFEQVQRVNWLQLQYATDATCAHDALGLAIQGVAQGQFQTSLTSGVKDGKMTVLFQFLGLGDLAGGDGAPTLGVMAGSPVTATGYDGTADLDWWYHADATTIDTSGNPLATVPAQIATGRLTAGPGTLVLSLSIGGSPSQVQMSSALLSVALGAANAPTVSTTGTTPGHLASENLDPALQSFAGMGTPDATGAGTLCGNLSASSLAQIALTTSVTGTCSSYTTANSILDLLVGGCSTAFGLIKVVNATQPDQIDPSAPAAGAGAPYALHTDGSHRVSSCTDRTGQAVALDVCLKSAAYSSYFKFTTDRVILK